MDAMPIHYGKHSPPPWPTATHATMQLPLHLDGLMASPPLAHTYQRQPARYHSLGDGHVQAHSVFGPELGTGQQQQPEAQQQLSHFSTQYLHHSSMALPHPARHKPPGVGHVQTGSALILEQCTGQPQLLRAATNAVTQDNTTHATMRWPRHSDGPMVSPPLAHMYQRQPARYHPLGDGHVQTHSVLGPELGTGQQQHPHYPTQILHHSPMALPHPARRQPPGEEHGQPGTSSVERHSLTRTASFHETTEPNDALGANSSWSAQVQPFGDGRGHTDPTPGPVQSSKPCLKNWTTQESHGQILHQERAAANLAEGCGQLAEFLAQFPWEEKRTGLGFAQLDVEQHLNSHNHICHRVMQMLEDLPIEAIHTTVATKLQRLHSVIQLSYIREWPEVFLQPETSTPEFDLVISEIAEFETKRMGFLRMVKETILSVYDTLTNPDRIEPNNCLPKLLPLLGTQSALTWIRFELPEGLTPPLLQLPTLQATFGLVGEIAEIFLFEPGPVGFITFYDSVQIPNCAGILAQRHGLIKIKNPSYSSPPIRSSRAPHYPTRKPAIGTLVACPAYDQKVGSRRRPYEAMVIAIERNHWPKEWRFLIRLEVLGEPPRPRTATPDRGTLNPLQDRH